MVVERREAEGPDAVVGLSVVREEQGRAHRGWAYSGGGGATARHNNRELEAKGGRQYHCRPLSALTSIL